MFKIDMVIDTNVKYKEIPYCFEVRKVCFNYNISNLTCQRHNILNQGYLLKILTHFNAHVNVQLNFHYPCLKG